MYIVYNYSYTMSYYMTFTLPNMVICHYLFYIC